ncbi:hypothetical protein PSA7680_02512 [Pseudoruegeria aquimaris]|uniref:Uncharacterized protein n=1 Tax=Pseudoruegeria aquimaris TaxID=393663 RepID=A0A1Y5SVA2_9RHOB|nr:hypothetical protein [Pseudoruegeria aquimaris]SLN48634.1 hypothetical protein PSA7680_02512 [Pseudoruegeria aquimaris]
MFFDFISTIAIGFCAAGVALLLNHLLRGRLPRWLAPVAAGAAMIGFTIWSEYTWYPRTLLTLPEGIEVAQTYEHTAPYRPWTYVKPYVNRFSAVDQATLRRNEKVPGQVMADVYLYSRWQPLARVPVLVDCEGSRMADLVAGAEFDADGAITNANWQALEPGEALLARTCAAGQGG